MWFGGTVSDGNTIDDLLSASAHRHAARPALTLDDRDLTWQDVRAAVDRLAARLADDVGPGRRVAVIAPNVPALAIGLWATWRLGGVAEPLSARYREYELRRLLRDAEPAAIVSVEAHGGYSFATPRSPT